MGSEGEPAIRVLVADDSAFVRTVVRRALEAAGHRVDEAEGGTQALRAALTTDYDVVVTDLRMPGLDGFGLLSTLKEQAVPAEVIILTGTHSNDMQSAIRALRLGAHDYLTKPPASAEEMIVTVERAAEKKRLRETNARLLEELERLSRTDGLTGLLNRRAFDEALRRETLRARRYRFPLSAVLLDIDRFKAVNDTYGHAVGDQVLRQFATVASRVFREADMLYRYGGEEFVALLPHTAAAGAVHASQRLLASLRTTTIPAGDRVLKVTCSAGVAELRRDDQDGSGLIARADAALYRAKADGRDRVLTAA
jgi:diguanylate cyclase (GGDEF)-like protein